MKNIRLISTLILIACALSAVLSVFGVCKTYSLSNSYNSLKVSAGNAISEIRRELKRVENAEAESDSVAVFSESDSAETFAGRNDTQSESEESSVVSVKYRIQAYNGKIAVFDCDDNIIRTLNVNVDSLPDQDKEILSQGILTSSKEEMLDIIADYAN